MAYEEFPTEADRRYALDPSRVAEEEFLSETFDAFGTGWESAISFETTAQRIFETLRLTRENNPPAPIQPYECRIGLSKFFIPPINISVNKRFKTGALTGGAIRQQNSPKFNSGHTETIITMTLYFPTVDDIWGTTSTKRTSGTIDFDDPNTSDEAIDSFLSSLRGLVTQFKYAPFLPIQNAYLNGTWGITGVAMKDLSVSTVPDFPFCMAATLVMNSFNHKVYLPMLDNFDQAIHYGRFRQYMGRAADRLQRATKRLNIADSSYKIGDLPEEQILDDTIVTARDLLNKQDLRDIDGETTFARPTPEVASQLKLYYPFASPGRIDIPDLRDLRPEEPSMSQRSRVWWERLLSVVGIDVNLFPEAHYSSMQRRAREAGEGNYPGLGGDRNILEYLTALNITVTEMNADALTEYSNRKLREEGLEPGSSAARERSAAIRASWFAVMYKSFLENPAMAAAFANDDKRRRQLTINEWDVPMIPLNLDYNYVTVEGVSMTLGNKFARLQLQLQDEPTHQHIGGEDTRIEVAMMVHGERAEQELTKIRNMYDAITGLARLNQRHGVMGFLGIGNIITELAGVSYVCPLNMSVDTVEGQPHVYRVTLSFVDFDIFQQKREQLSSIQQAQLVEQFGKRNPFFRAKQLWSAFNAYPDFPLDVRNDEGEVVGHLDPDWYFRAFKMTDDDIVQRNGSSGKKSEKGGRSGGKSSDTRASAYEENQARIRGSGGANENFLWEDGIHFNFGSVDGDPQYITVNDKGLTARSGQEVNFEDMPISEMHAGSINESTVPNLTPPSGYVESYMGGSSSVMEQFEAMSLDMQYRDKSGRMVRAFPTYMLWLIDEGGMGVGIKLFNNFYGLQSVLDLSVHRSEDVMADTLVMRVSNLYSKLSTPFRDYLDENDPGAVMFNEMLTRQLRVLSGVGNYLINLQSMRLQPGMRLHLRMGYTNNPNAMETVFNGKITQVEHGDIITLTAQSDAIELGALVNSSDEKGHSGEHDGSMTGLYLSEPRDLMIDLLTQGSSKVKELVAHAALGEIFSENRYGIRHFGTMFYTPLTVEEAEKQGRQQRYLSNRLVLPPDESDDPLARVGSVFNILRDIEINLRAKRDYEVFKRNIYPGNGLGIGQYLGGDLGDIILAQAVDGSKGVVEGVGFSSEGTSHAVDPLTGQPIEVNPSNATNSAKDIQRAEGLSNDQLGNFVVPNKNKNRSAPPPNPAAQGLRDRLNLNTDASVRTTYSREGISDLLGLTDFGDDDGEFNEIAFRAQTYMKTVWDMFKLCAALLPDYIVAVRPFEDRSTVFYGKPHWLYTAGLIPLTTGPNPEGDDSVSLLRPDAVLQRLVQELEAAYAARDDVFAQNIIAAVRGAGRTDQQSVDPTLTSGGMNYTNAPESIMSLPTSRSDGTPLPYTEGSVHPEMHIPTSENLSEDISNQKPYQSMLDPQHQHPFYMDRKGGPRGGRASINKFNPREDPLKQTILAGEDPGAPGNTGFFGYGLSAEEEAWYMCQYWQGSGDSQRAWRGERILVYRPDNKKAVVCTPGDKGPSPNVNVIAGLSPESWYALGRPDSTVKLVFRVMARNTPLGPVNFSPSSGSEVDTIRREKEMMKGKTPDQSQIAPSSGVPIPSWANGNTNLQKVSDKHGWYKEGIPVNYTKESVQNVDYGNGDSKTGILYEYYDSKGENASQVYREYRTEEDANQIWDEIRKRLPDDPNMKDVFRQAHAQLRSDANQDPLTDAEMDRLVEQEFDSTMANYLKYLWDGQSNEPAAGFRRGWVVRVADRLITDFDPTNFVFERGEWDLAFLQFPFGVYIVRGEEGLDNYISENHDVGRDANNIITRAGEEIGRVVDETLDGLQAIAGAVGQGFSGLFNYLRLSLSQATGAIGLANEQQLKANTLNRVYNDSIYYSAGIGPDGTVINPLLFYADNPFTREYGEPVAEIREPFQRMHHLSSFRHIIHNAVQETTDNVATVITALSNGADPVTVHFDKGTPSEHQLEKTVETGLYWDDPGFWGRLNPLNWYQQARETRLKLRGTSPELSAKRVALWHLKENLKNIYGGEITILGDATIRPYDMCYLFDSYESMSGIFEVEQVVHHLSPDTGFITSITPNAAVTINDPSRFYVMSNLAGRNAVGAMRERLRNHLNVTVDGTAGIDVASGNRSDELDIEILESELEDAIRNTTLYYGGSSQLIKSVLSGAGLPLMQLSPGAAFAGWKMWEWVRDNLLDQHGCYISYLTKDGEAMDAGLSYNQGVAVGHRHSRGLLLGSLKVGEITTVDHAGNTRIKMQDVIPSLQPDEEGPNEVARELSLFINATLAELRQLSGRYGDLLPDPDDYEIYLGKVVRVIDGDTMEVMVTKHYQFGQLSPASNVPLGNIRLGGAQAPEDNQFKAASQETRQQLRNTDPGVRATEYAKDQLLNRTVALRIPKRRDRSYDRTIAYMFHNAPNSISSQQNIEEYLARAAGQMPLRRWDSFTEDGQPLTFDWELIIKGMADVESSELRDPLTGQVEGFSLDSNTNTLGNTG